MDPTVATDVGRSARVSVTALCSILNTLGSHPELDVVLQRVLEKTLEVFGFSAGVVRLLDPPTGELRPAADAGLSPGLSAELMQPVSVEDAPFGLSLQCRDLAIVDDLLHSPYADSPWARHGYRTFLSLPLQYQEMLLGCLNVFTRRIRPLEEAERESLIVVANQVGMAVANARLSALAPAEPQHARQASEAELRRANQTLGALIHASPLAIAAVDVEADVTLWNPAAERLFGWTEEEVLGRPIPNILHELQAEFRSRFQQALEGQVFSGVETRRRRKDGTVIDVALWTAPLRDHHGATSGNVALLADITERKRVEEGLRAIASKARCLLWHAEVEEMGGSRLRWKPSFVDEEAARRFLPVSRAPGESYFDAWYESRLEEDKVRTDAYGFGEIRAGRSYAQEFRCRRLDGEIRWLVEDVQIEPLAPNLWRAVGVCVDITERKRAEEALKETVRRLNILVDTAKSTDTSLHILLQWLLRRLVADIPAADTGSVFLYDPHDHALLPAAGVRYDMNGFSQIRVQPGEGMGGRVFETGRPLLAATPEEMAALDRELSPENARLFSQAQRERQMVSSICAPLHTQTGEIIGTLSLSSTHSRFTSEELSLLEGLAAQATVSIQNARLFEQVEAGRQRLQALSHRLVEMQETERYRIARELHDEVGQLLTRLDLMLKLMTRLSAARIRESLGDAQALVGELTTRVRELSLDLRPAMLDDLGLLPALLWHVERYAAQTGVRVNFEHNGLEQRCHRDVETAAYRIVQEALTNVARHAGVNDVTVRLWANQDTLWVQIEDQGVGFDSRAALAAGASSGLVGMRERATLAGGQLVIEAAPGKGVLLMADFPLGGPGDGEREER